MDSMPSSSKLATKTLRSMVIVPRRLSFLLKAPFPPTSFQALLCHPCDTLRGNVNVTQMH